MGACGRLVEGIVSVGVFAGSHLVTIVTADTTLSVTLTNYSGPATSDDDRSSAKTRSC